VEVDVNAAVAKELNRRNNDIVNKMGIIGGAAATAGMGAVIGGVAEAAGIGVAAEGGAAKLAQTAVGAISKAAHMHSHILP